MCDFKTYSAKDHFHRFACWTAARAVQRGFTGAKTAVIAKAIDDIKLAKEFENLATQQDLKAALYDKEHERISKELSAALLRNGALHPNYGQTTKIIAIYFKTAVLPFHLDTALAKVAHPPIDRQLLENLAKCGKYYKEPKSRAWTKFERDDYFKCVVRLREEIGDQPFWMIEECWGSNSVI
ncbi:MAG: hypothetical protein AAF741_03455 [Bacteroidota bacterium]